MTNKKDLKVLNKKVEAALAPIRKLREDIEELAKPLVAELINIIFNNFPEVTAISVEAYTDYFNDGEACTYRVHEAEVSFTKEFPEEFDVDDFKWVGEYTDNSELIYAQEGLDDHLTMLNKAFSEINDIFMAVYGDHVKVVFTRDAIESFEYDDHD